MHDQLVTRLLPILANRSEDEFNIFNVMHHGSHEKQISNVFAWLLDANGTHKLGDTFQQMFVDEVNGGLGDQRIPPGKYRVRQEVNTSDPDKPMDIADLVLEGNTGTVLVVENYDISCGHGHSYEGCLGTRWVAGTCALLNTHRLSPCLFASCALSILVGQKEMVARVEVSERLRARRMPRQNDGRCATSEWCHDGPNRGRGSAGQIAGLHASKCILGLGAFGRSLRYGSDEFFVRRGIRGGQLQFDEAVRGDRID